MKALPELYDHRLTEAKSPCSGKRSALYGFFRWHWQWRHQKLFGQDGFGFCSWPDKPDGLADWPQDLLSPRFIN